MGSEKSSPLSQKPLCEALGNLKSGLSYTPCYHAFMDVFALVVGGVMGVTLFAPLARRRADALESGDDVTATDAQARIIPLALLDTALVLLAVLAMVDRWAS